MQQFQIRIADTLFQVEGGSDALRDRVSAFLAEDSTFPQYTFAVTEEAVTHERNLALSSLGHDNFEPVVFESSALARHVIACLYEEDILLMHAASVSLDGKAYLFSAPSGTGKSTHAALWKQVFGERMAWINDDKPFLRFGQDEVRVYGSPWTGKEGRGANTSAPLAGIACIRQGETNQALPMTQDEKWRFLMVEVYLDRTPEGTPKTLSLMEELMTRSPIIRMDCTMDPEAADICYRALRPVSQAEQR